MNILYDIGWWNNHKEAERIHNLIGVTFAEKPKSVGELLFLVVHTTSSILWLAFFVLAVMQIASKISIDIGINW